MGRRLKVDINMVELFLIEIKIDKGKKEDGNTKEIKISTYIKTREELAKSLDFEN